MNVLHWAVENSAVCAYTIIEDNQVLVAFGNGLSAFVGELPDNRFLVIMCSSNSHSVDAYAFSDLENFKHGIVVIGR